MNRASSPRASHDDGDLTSYYAYFVGRAKRFYKLLLVLLAIFSIGVIIYVHVAQPVYLAVAALTPPKDALLESTGLNNSTGGLASLGRRLGFGFSGASSEGNYDLFDEYTRVLQSYRLAGSLAARPEFLSLALPTLFDPRTGHLKPRQGLTAALSDVAKTVLGLPLSPASDEDQVYRFLTTNLTISQPHDPTTNISEVTLRFENATAAQKILDIILAQADTLMRTDKRKDIVARVSYIQDQLQTATLEDQRNVLIQLLGAQQNTMMIIAADHRYASYVVEPPHTPQKPSWPNTGGLFGLILFLSFVVWAPAITFLPESRLAYFSTETSLLNQLRRGPRAAIKNYI